MLPVFFCTRDYRQYRVQAPPEGPPWLWLHAQNSDIKKPSGLGWVFSVVSRLKS